MGDTKASSKGRKQTVAKTLSAEDEAQLGVAAMRKAQTAIEDS